MGDATTLDRGVTLAEESVENPWRRALTCERLEAAKQMISVTPFGEQAAWRLRRRWVGAAAVILMVGTLAAVIAIGHRALLAPLGIVCAALALTFSERRHSEQLRMLLVRQASAEPATGDVVVPEAAIVDAVNVLTSTHTRVEALARSFVATWPGPERPVALRRLGGVNPARRRTSRLELDIGVWSLAAVALTPLMEAL